MATPAPTKEQVAEIFKTMETSGFEDVLIENSTSMHKGILHMHATLPIDNPPLFTTKLYPVHIRSKSEAYEFHPFTLRSLIEILAIGGLNIISGKFILNLRDVINKTPSDELCYLLLIPYPGNTVLTYYCPITKYTNMKLTMHALNGEIVVSKDIIVNPKKDSKFGRAIYINKATYDDHTHESKKSHRICSFCGTQNINAKLCSRCKTAYYCNADCQKSDWKKHKIICKMMMQTDTKINRICIYCKSITTTSIPCNNCKAYYCNINCQKKDKNRHEENCN